MNSNLGMRLPGTVKDGDFNLPGTYNFLDFQTQAFFQSGSIKDHKNQDWYCEKATKACRNAAHGN